MTLACRWAGVTITLYLDRGERAFDTGEILGRQFHLSGLDVLLEAMQLGGAGDRHDPALLRQQPCESHLGRGCLLARGNLREEIDEYLVGLSRLLRKARHDVAKVFAVEGGRLADRAGEEALAKRAEGHETDAEFFERRQDFLLGFAPPQRIFALECRHRLDGMGAADRLGARFREA